MVKNCGYAYLNIPYSPFNPRCCASICNGGYCNPGGCCQKGGCRPTGNCCPKGDCCQNGGSCNKCDCLPFSLTNCFTCSYYNFPAYYNCCPSVYKVCCPCDCSCDSHCDKKQQCQQRDGVQTQDVEW